MKKLFPLIIVLAFTGCSNKTEWSKSGLVSKCESDMKKDKDVSGMLTPEKIKKVCECCTDKLMAKYKSEAEADKDVTGVEEIGKSCAIEVLMGGK